MGEPREPLDYPFAQPTGPTLWRLRHITALDGDLDELLGGRHPILAVGSNSSPRQLDRKFADFVADRDGSETCIPITPATVEGLDVVYAAWVASYGSVPATAVRQPGAVAYVFITWLTPRQLERMDHSEGNGYSRQAIGGVTSLNRGIEDVTGYVFVEGELNVDGGPVGLAEIRVVNGSNVRMTQRQVWDWLVENKGPGGSGARYCHSVAADAQLRRSLQKRLVSDSLRLNS